jgi:hypothetical protein
VGVHQEGVLRDQDEIAQQRDAAPEADRRAVHGGDDRKAALHHVLHDLARFLHAAAVKLLTVDQLALPGQITTRAERLAGTR